MPENSQLIQYMYGFFTLLSIAGLIGAFKMVDWLIGQKYVSHDKCEKCRGEIYKSIATDHDLLHNIDGKMDLLLECFNVEHKK